MDSIRLQMPGFSALHLRGPAVRLMQVVGCMAAMLVAAPALAQTDGALVVSVLDEDGLEVPNVTVTLTGSKLIGGAQSKTTDFDGVVRFSNLKPGDDYTLIAESDTLAMSTVNNVQVIVSRETQVQITMNVMETVTVAKEQVIDTSSSSRGTVLTKEFLNRVPTGRSYQEAATLNVASGQGSQEENLGGAANNENTYIVDGVNVTDPVSGTFGANFNFDAIEQIEVLLGGYMPEYGVSLGGVVNVVTESGSNNLSMTTSVFYVNGNIRPRIDARIGSDGVLLAASGFDNNLQILTIGTQVSGPIVRDKAFFLISYQHSRSLINANATPQRQDFDGHQLYGKVTVQESSEHRFTGIFSGASDNIDNIFQGSPFIKAESQGRQRQGSMFGSARWEWFISPDVNVETRVNYFRNNFISSTVPCTHDPSRDQRQCRPDEAENEIDWYTPGRIGTGGAFDSVNNVNFGFVNRSRLELSSKLSLTSIEDPLGGKHDIKVGVSTEQLAQNTIRGNNGNLVYFDTNAVDFDPTTFTNFYWQETSAPINYRQTGSIYSFFLQDSWKPHPNLTLNFGTRFDNAIMRNDLGEATLAGALWGPRIFASWDPFGDQKTKIATGYGRFNDRGSLQISGFTDASGFGSKIWFGEINDNFTNRTEDNFAYNPVRNLNVAHDELSNPHTDEVLFIAEREVIRDVALSTTLNGRFSRNMFEFDDPNWIMSGNGDSIIGARTGDIDTFRARLRTPTLARRDVFSWELSARKVWADRWAAILSYGFNQVYGSSPRALSGSFANDPQTQYNYGRLVNIQNHVVVGQLIADIPLDPWTPQIGVVFRAVSGIPSERFYYSARAQGFGVRLRERGNYTVAPSWWELSARYTQNLNVRQGQVALSVEVQNLTNNRAGDRLNAFQLAANNRYVFFDRQQPLRVQLGAQYKF